MKHHEPEYDVIIVGSGPSGSTAARELARRGAAVLLLDQAPFPRAKPCGGCLSLKMDTILDHGYHDVVERTVYGATFTADGAETLHLRSTEPIAYMVTRERFDHLLAREARREGARFIDGCRVLDAQETEEGVLIRTTNREYEARYLVGADGANGVVGRRRGLAPDRRLAVCLEGEVTLAPDASSVVDDEVRIEFGAIPFGYGWVFPKGDHLSVGVGGLREKIGNPRVFYDEFLADQDLLDAIEGERRRGWIIPVYDGQRPLASRRTLLVGDAASLVDPFLGEGIYHAVRSGQLAADALAKALETGDPEFVGAYPASVEAEMYPEFRAAARLARFLFAFPKLGLEVLRRRPSFVRRYFGVLRGEATYADLWDDLRRHAVSDAVGVAWTAITSPRDPTAHYDRLASRYDSALRLWRTLVAEPAWDGLGALMARHVPAGGSVLDAGTGTGALVERLLEKADPGAVVGLDLSKAMLREARKKIRDSRVSWRRGDVTALPFPDGTFDTVVSSWTLETLSDPRAAVREFLRVLKDDGYVIYAFSSSTMRRATGFLNALVLAWSEGRLHSHPIGPERRPYHHCEHSQLATYGGGLATVVVLRKCCSVDDPFAPCLPVNVASRRVRAEG